MEPIGRRRWAIAEGHLPRWSASTRRDLVSHETACLLNATSEPAHVEITVFYRDREPGSPYRLVVPPRRTVHLRFDDLDEPEPIPRATDFSCAIESDVPIVVQHTRLDSRSAELSLMTTGAYGE